jgi:bifunctional ADP-heptose synthase (sugar kinase/adenylyltransferase)
MSSGCPVEIVLQKLTLFRQAKALGDYLIVGINKDEDCIGYKRKPILNTMERVKVCFLLFKKKKYEII